MSKSKKIYKKEIPTGVKIIAVFSYIGAVISLLIGITFTFGAQYILPLIHNSAFTLKSIIIKGIINLVSAIVGFFIGRGLFAGKNWARGLATLFCAIGIIFSLSPFNAFSLVLSLIIILYLLLSKDVDAAFK